MEYRMIVLLVVFSLITIVLAKQIDVSTNTEHIMGKNSISHDDVKDSMDILYDFLSDEYTPERYADVDTDIANDQSSCVEDKTAYIGNNINARSNIASWRACSEFCRTISACNAWSYQKSGGFCYAKTSDKGRFTLSSYVSGAKSCPPINGGWGAWMPYLTCSKTCGPGTQQRFRYCNNPAPKYNGLNCSGQASQSRSCNVKPCPVNGGWGAWMPYLTCSKTCGPGTQQRFRYCNNPAPEHNGLDCSGQASQSRSCNVKPCPVNGGWANWMAWTTCSGCMGTQQRFRYCINPIPAHGGVTCPGVMTQAQSCMLMGAGCNSDDEPKDKKDEGTDGSPEINADGTA